MGKGNRNKQERAQRESEVDQYLTRSEKIKRKKDIKSGRVTSAICIILVVAILLASVCLILSSAGVFAKVSNKVTTTMEAKEGHFKVNKGMMNFFFNEQIMSWYGQYGAYVQYFGLSFGSDLKKQEYSKDSTTGAVTTWYDYFLEQTKSQVKLYLAYANAAWDMDLRLDDDDKEEIKGVIDKLNEYMDGLGLKYSDFYGPGVGKGDIEDCYEIIYLSNKYSEVMTEEYKNQLKADDKDVWAYPDSNKEDFYSADVLKYTIQIKESDYENREAYDKAVASAKERAEKLAAVNTVEEFFELIKVDLDLIAKEEAEREEADKNNGDEEGPALPEDETDKSDENAGDDPEEEPTEEPDLDDYRQNIEYSTEKDNELYDWLFGENPANKGDTHTESATEEYTEKATTSSAATKEAEPEEDKDESKEDNKDKKYEKFTISVYQVETPMDLDYDLTRNLGYFVTNDKATAEKILAAFKNGTMSAQRLDELGQAEADVLPDDTKISIGHSDAKQVVPGYFDQNSFGAVEDWLESEEAVPGAVSGVIEIKPSSSSGTTYYSICYFESWDKETWYVNATTGVVNQRFEHWYQGADGNGGVLASNPITINDKACGDLYQTLVPYMLSQSSSSSTSTS